MYYELYADSLWLINFVMNLYLLMLVDRSSLRTATRMRMILSAAIGAFLYLLPFLWAAPVWLKYSAGVLSGTLAMVYIAFRPGSIRAYAKILEKLLVYSFLMGGLLLFFAGSFPFIRRKILHISGVAGLGGVGFLLATYLQDIWRAKRQNKTCRVTLIRSGRSVCAEALIDTGNSLVEPISGQPVSIIDEGIYLKLWQEEEELYRVVPYRSIGKRHGLLRGYVLPELKVEEDGLMKSFSNVYVAVSREYTGRVSVILNPALLDGIAGKEIKSEREKRN